MRSTIAVALSGGVDSLAAAYLLKQQGLDVIGIHFSHGFEIEPDSAGQDDLRATSTNDIFLRNLAEKVHSIAKRLDIPLEQINLHDEFKETVVDYFVRTYQEGRTPNPCLVCNPSIKFGVLMKHALDRGASKLATGHYASIHADKDGRYHLFKGVDAAKDQSYFLAFLTQKQLSSIRFPLGELTKKEVQTLVATNNLLPAHQAESQDVCFIGRSGYVRFLQDQGIQSIPGPIVDAEGNRIGEHKGLHRYTVGQRQGINCPASEPYYVLELDVPNNQLVVGFKKELLKTKCRVAEINWLQPPSESPMRLATRLRYGHMAAPSSVFRIDSRTAVVQFERPQSAVTPGQGAVFYHGNEVVGAGWIV